MIFYKFLIPLIIAGGIATVMSDKGPLDTVTNKSSFPENPPASSSGTMEANSLAYSGPSAYSDLSDYSRPLDDSSLVDSSSPVNYSRAGGTVYYANGAAGYYLVNGRYYYYSHHFRRLVDRPPSRGYNKERTPTFHPNSSGNPSRSGNTRQYTQAGGGYTQPLVEARQQPVSPQRHYFIRGAAW